MGDWKVVRQHLKDDKELATLELYNLRLDHLEMTNVAEEHPDILKKAARIFKEERTSPELDIFKIPALANGLYND